jgi:hypothetical protein
VFKFIILSFSSSPMAEKRELEVTEATEVGPVLKEARIEPVSYEVFYIIEVGYGADTVMMTYALDQASVTPATLEIIKQAIADGMATATAAVVNENDENDENDTLGSWEWIYHPLSFLTGTPPYKDHGRDADTICEELRALTPEERGKWTVIKNGDLMRFNGSSVCYILETEY